MDDNIPINLYSQDTAIGRPLVDIGAHGDLIRPCPGLKH